MLNGAHQRPGGHGDVERVAGREAAALGHRSDALHGGGDIVGSAAGNTSVDAAEYADTSSHSHTRPKAPTPDSAAPWQPTSRPDSIGDDHGGASRRAHPGVAPSSGDADTAHSQWEHSAGAAVRTRGVGPHGLHRRGNATRDHGGSPVSVTKSSGQQGGRHGSMFSGSRAPVVNSPSRHASAVALVHGDASPGGWMPWFWVQQVVVRWEVDTLLCRRTVQQVTCTHVLQAPWRPTTRPGRRQTPRSGAPWPACLQSRCTQRSVQQAS